MANPGDRKWMIHHFMEFRKKSCYGCREPNQPAIANEHKVLEADRPLSQIGRFIRGGVAILFSLVRLS